MAENWMGCLSAFRAVTWRKSLKFINITKERSEKIYHLFVEKMNFNSSRGHSELMDFYRHAASNYDKEVSEVRGYVAPENSAPLLAKALKEYQFNTSCKIIDVGAGTGLVARQLQKFGYSNIDALDCSSEMLQMAQQHGLYKNYINGELGPGKKLSIETDFYDCAISVGVFTVAHVKAEGAMDEIARVVRPGGLVCFTIREDAMKQEEVYGYGMKMKELCDSGTWKLLSVTKEVYHVKYDHAKCFFYMYQIL